MIGIIDSGVGGLGIISEFLKQEKEIPFVYLGDTANNPYGNKDAKTIQHLAINMIDYLISTYQIDTLIIACNTVVSVALPELRKKYPKLHIEDILSHGAIAATMSFTETITTIATQLTVASKAYERRIHDFVPEATVQQLAAQNWVAMVERDNVEQENITSILKQMDPKSDMIILGCTHFPFLYEDIRAITDAAIQIIDPALSCVQNFDYIPDSNWMKKSIFLTTGDVQPFNNFLERKNLNPYGINVQQAKLK